MLTPNSILQNRYRIVRELGHGGMGTVYEAVDQRVNCLVALKETIAGNDKEARGAFEHEASLLGNIRHSTLPKVMDYFTEGDGAFLVMEFIPGYDLAELLESRESPFPQSQVLRWADELLRVLEYLHGQEPPILHRDIKPSNLKLTKQGEIFLLDFGLAKGSIGQMPTLATSRSVRGYTPIYASLEQIHGQGTDARSDLYSLGATLYHLLAGVPPVDAPTRFHIVEEDQSDPLPPIEKINAQASPSVAAVIHRAMAVSRKHRPISAVEMRKALRNAAEEDERRSAEEEYARAEARRRQREDERRGAEVLAVTHAEERQREAEARKEQEARRQDAERRLQDEAAQRRAEELAVAEAKKRAEEQRLRREAEEREAEKKMNSGDLGQVPKPVVATTVRGQEPSLDQSAPPPRPQETMRVPPPDRLTLDQFSASLNTQPEVARPIAVSSKRNLVIGAVVLVVFATVALLIWSLRGKSTGQDASSASQSGKETAQISNAPTPPAGMVYVSGGKFMLGRDNGDVGERPAHQVNVNQFFIDTYEVTNEDFLKFVQAKGRRDPTTWAGGNYPAGASRKPVTGVMWNDATGYCEWAGKRLPGEEEWEFAARGTDGRIYPWGNNWQRGSANANSESNGLADVGSYKGMSPFGAFDMAGNAWEWTASDFRSYPGGHLPANLPAGNLKVIRGGTYDSGQAVATTTYRTGWPASGARTYDQTGFRCVKDIAP